MIIDIKGLLQKILKKRSLEKNNLEYDMVFENGYFVPKISSGQKTVDIPAFTEKGEELVGLCIVEKQSPKSTPAVLTTNGMFVRVDNTRATDVMLFSTYKDALNAIEELGQHSMTKNPVGRLTVFAGYQLNRELGLTFIELRR